MNRRRLQVTLMTVALVLLSGALLLSDLPWHVKANAVVTHAAAVMTIWWPAP